MNIEQFNFYRYNFKYYFETKQNDIIFEGEVVFSHGYFGKNEVGIYVSHIEPAPTNETEATEQEKEIMELLFEANKDLILNAKIL